MIREIGVELLAQLRASGVPIDVVNGPESSTTATFGRERIVIEYDTGAADGIVQTRLHGTNPRKRYIAVESCKLTIYAQSTVAGPSVFEHRRRAKLVRNKVLVAMDYVAANRKSRWKPTAGRFITPPDLAASDAPGGAVYELTFTFEHAVEARSWAGSKRPEGTIGALHSSTSVSLTGADDETPETACGA